MCDLDLNATPTDLGSQNDNGNDAGPVFCTQPPTAETIGESPDPVNAGQEDNDGQAHSHGVQHNPSIPTTTAPTTTYPADGDGVENVEEVVSSPQEPFIGMRFDTLADAKEHYNAYAKRVGFSIKADTSKKKAHSNVLEKQ